MTKKDTFGLVFSLFLGCISLSSAQTVRPKSIPQPKFLQRAVVDYDVPMRNYFTFMDSFVLAYNSILSYQLTELVLVRANPFLIEALENTDYYRKQEHGVFVFDQQNGIILKKGTILNIPSASYAETLLFEMGQTRLDVNIPEFKLRIIVGNDTPYIAPIRVGQNRDRYLSEVGREHDLRTRTGRGSIVNAYKNSSFIEPTESKFVETTLRDDGKRTKMPLQPWIETEINGQRMGQLIHATTNPRTLESPYSNGCMGVREADIWRIYYYAPIGTPITIRYDLNVVNELGELRTLRDIYKREISHDLIEESNSKL